MMHQLPTSSSVSSATSLAINSATVTIRETAAVADDTVEQGYSESSSNVKQDQLFTTYSPDTLMKPDIGILGRDFLTNKGREQPVYKKFAKQFSIHQKKRVAVDVDVDVGILDRRRRQQQFDANLRATNKVTGRSLQSEEELPFMCPGKGGGPGWYYFANLFNQTDHFFFTEEGYFPKCRCPSPTTCGPELCECLELNADGDILQCMDPFKQLCEGAKYISGIPGPWSMEQCLGSKFLAINYCSYLPCFLDGGSYWQCNCEWEEKSCTEYRDKRPCAKSKCCQAQTDDEGRKACILGDLSQNYYDQVTSFSISKKEVISRFNECSFNSDSGKSIVQCYCESFTYGRCVNYGAKSPNSCEANICCFEQTEDDARLDCFSRFGMIGWGFHDALDTIQEGCIASGRSSDQCKCDIHGLSNCVHEFDFYRKPRCDLFQCCQSQTDNNDEGRKDCLVQDEAQLRYEECIDYGADETCICDKSTTLCTAGHSSDRHCELSSCCQNQTDDTGRKECIGNFTTSQPSSAPSETTPAEESKSPTAISALPGTSSASTPNPFGAEPLAKTRMLAVAAITVSLLLT